MSRKSEFIILCVLAIVLFSILYYSATSKTKSMNTKKNKWKADSTLQKKLYIASAESEFKDTVAEKIVTYYKGKITIVSIRIDSLVSLQKDDYTVLAVLNSCWGREFQPKVMSFLNRIQDLSSIIVFTTYKYADRQPDMEKWNVDAVTSASQMAKADSVANIIIEKINIRLKNH